MDTIKHTINGVEFVTTTDVAYYLGFNTSNAEIVCVLVDQARIKVESSPVIANYCRLESKTNEKI